MQLSKKKRELITEIERIIGGSCYNGNIQNFGPGGSYEGSGRWIYYPITFEKKDGSRLKRPRPKELAEVDDDEYLTGHYVFGANKLAINKAIRDVLDHLEREYGWQLDEA